MPGVYLFWGWVVLSSLAVYLAGRFRLGPWPLRLYRPLLVVAFSVTTLSAVSSYVGWAFGGKTDWAITILWLQHLINPVVRTVVALEPFAMFAYDHLPELSMSGGGNPTGVAVTFTLWEVMVQDLFLGTLSWLGVGTLWLRFVRRRTSPSEEPGET